MLEVASKQREAGRAAKRALDLAGAALGLMLLSPLLAATALALIVTQGRPVLFRHVRPGLKGRPFTILKFRTMRDPRPGEDRYGSDASRLTRLGRWLRETSVDELPELWNVLCGEMSLVGPRPLLTEYLDQYTSEEGRRHDVLPGITGWAQVNGRHAISYRERLRLDLWYVDHWSLWLDLRILARTAHQVLRRKDVTTTQSAEQLGFPLPPVIVGEEPKAGAPSSGGGGPSAGSRRAHHDALEAVERRPTSSAGR
jgi:lipopolysaccharide/colanic/teichoic acid biosynthesis glycosyltransferase